MDFFLRLVGLLGCMEMVWGGIGMVLGGIGMLFGGIGMIFGGIVWYLVVLCGIGMVLGGIGMGLCGMGWYVSQIGLLAANPRSGNDTCEEQDSMSNGDGGPDNLELDGTDIYQRIRRQNKWRILGRLIVLVLVISVLLGFFVYNLHTSNTDLTSRIKELERKILIDINIDKLQRDVEELEKKSAILKPTVDKMEETVAKLKPYVKNLDKTFQELKPKVEKVDKTMVTLGPKVEELSNAVVKWEPDIKKINETVAKLKPVVESLNKIVVSLEPNVTSLDETVATLEPKVGRMDETVVKLEPKVEDLNERVTELDIAVSGTEKWRDNVTELQGRFRKLEHYCWEKLPESINRLDNQELASLSQTSYIYVLIAVIACLIVWLVSNYSQMAGIRNALVNQQQEIPTMSGGQTPPVHQELYRPVRSVLDSIQRTTLAKQICVISFYSESKAFHMRLVESACSGELSTVDRTSSLVLKHETILNLPRAKIFLLFVDFNEHDIILEHPDRGIDDLKMTTVQGARKMGGDVFVVYVKDKGSRNLDPGHLYNERLRSITTHPELSVLSRNQRVLTTFEEFTLFQRDHLTKSFIKTLQR